METAKVSIHIKGDATQLTRTKFLDLCLEAYNAQLEKKRRKGEVTERYYYSLCRKLKLDTAMAIERRTTEEMKKTETGEELTAVKKLYYADTNAELGTLVAYVLDITNEKGEYSLKRLANYADAVKTLERLYKKTTALWDKEIAKIWKWSLTETPFEDDREFSSAIMTRDVNKLINALLAENDVPASLAPSVSTWYRCFFPYIALQRKKLLKKDPFYSEESVRRTVPLFLAFLKGERERQKKKATANG